MARTTNPNFFYGHALLGAYDTSRSTFAVDTEGNNFKNCAVSSTTRVSNGAGVLHALAIGTKGGTAVAYDSLTGSGTVIAKVSATFEGTLLLDVAYSTGLTIVTGATLDCTAIYRPAVGTISSASVSPSLSASPSASASPSGSPSASPSASTSPSRSSSPSATNSPSSSPSLSAKSDLWWYLSSSYRSRRVW